MTTSDALLAKISDGEEVIVDAKHCTAALLMDLASAAHRSGGVLRIVHAECLTGETLLALGMAGRGRLRLTV